MSTPIPRPGAFVLEVAELGKEVLSTFTEFVLSRKVQGRRLETLLATLSITTSLLVDLGTKINTHEKDIHLRDEITRPTCETCKADFEKLIVLSKEAKEKGAWTAEISSGMPVATELDPWFIFNVALGGQEKGEEFWARLDATRYSLVALNDTLKYKVLSELNKRNLLQPKQVEELKGMMALLPILIQALERTERERKKRLMLEEKAQKTVKGSKNRPNVGDNIDLTLDKETKDVKDADDASELTMFEDELDIRVNKGRRLRYAPSIGSIPYDRWDENHYHEDSKVIFEEWVISWNPPRKDVCKSYGLLGLKIKEFYEDPGFWGIDPEMRAQSELQSVYENTSSGMPDAKYRASVDKSVRALPEGARLLIDGLIKDREESTSNERYIRQWSIAAVRPKNKHAYNASNSWFKKAKANDWLIMIKGTTLGRSERTLPSRFNDPWRKPYHYNDRPSSFARENTIMNNDRDCIRPRRPEIIYPERRFGRPPPIPRPRSPVYFEEEPRWDPPIVRERVREFDVADGGYTSRRVFVGTFESQENAEERMEKILEGFGCDIRLDESVREIVDD